MSEIERYANDTGIRTIYLSTDSEHVIEEAAAYPQYEFLFLKGVDRSNYDLNRDIRLAIVDMLLLSKCHVFLGKFSSNFFRAAYALHAANCDCAAPYVSLDAPWCFDHGMRAGSNLLFPSLDSITNVPNDNKFWC